MCIYIYGGPFFCVSFFHFLALFAFLLFFFSASLLLRFSASPLLLLLRFSCFSAFLLFCFFVFFAFLLLCFSASLLFCFLASPLFCFSCFGAFFFLLFCLSAFPLSWRRLITVFVAFARWPLQAQFWDAATWDLAAGLARQCCPVWKMGTYRGKSFIFTIRDCQDDWSVAVNNNHVQHFRMSAILLYAMLRPRRFAL